MSLTWNVKTKISKESGENVQMPEIPEFAAGIRYEDCGIQEDEDEYGVAPNLPRFRG
jgi:hypothetical protein